MRRPSSSSPREPSSCSAGGSRTSSHSPDDQGGDLHRLERAVPTGLAEELAVIVVPVATLLDGEPFDEGREPLDRFYERLSEGAHATTALPSPGAFLEAFTAAARAGAEEVISIHLDARVSGTLRSAELASQEAPLPVTVVDAGTVSFGLGACVRAAVEATLDGASADDVAAIVTRLAGGMRNVFVAPGAPGGRVPGTAGWAVLTFADATTQVIAACGSLDEALEPTLGQILVATMPYRNVPGLASNLRAGASNITWTSRSRL